MDNTALISAVTAQPLEYVNWMRNFSMWFGYINGTENILEPVGITGEETSMPLTAFVHSHAHYELVYVLDGVFTHSIESTQFRLNAGDATLMNSHIHHMESFDTKCIILYINIAPTLFQKLITENPLEPGQKQHNCQVISDFFFPSEETSSYRPGYALNFYRTQKNRLQLEMPNIDQTHANLNRIIHLLIEKDCGYAFDVLSSILKLLQTFVDKDHYHITKLKTDTSSEDILFTNIIHFMTERHGRISRNALAELLHYNPDYVNRVVKRHTGLSFQQFSKSMWIDHTKQLLSTTDLSISEILSVLNFENASYFYRVFLKETGMTPQEYRKLYHLDLANE